jgi:hypothetical protein
MPARQKAIALTYAIALLQVWNVVVVESRLFYWMGTGLQSPCQSRGTTLANLIASA